MSRNHWQVTEIITKERVRALRGYKILYPRPWDLDLDDL